MPTEPIPFGANQQSGHQELSGGSPFAKNVATDGLGTVRRRPGIQAYAAAPASAVDGDGISLLHETVSGDLFAVSNHASNKKIYRISGGAAVDVSALSGYRIPGTKRPTVAETSAMLVFAAGSSPLKYQFSALSTSLLGGSPPQSTHVIANSSRLLLNRVVTDTGRIFYSGTASGSSVAGHETWSGLTAGFFSAESRPDPVVALHETSGEVFAWGSTSMQYFAPDAATVYAPVSTLEHGCSAPYSICRVDKSFAWLDDRRRFVVSDGRQVQVISQAIQQNLNDLATIGDCFGYRFHSGPVEALVWTFPADGRTFAYQVGGGWSQWHGFAAGAWTLFPVLSHFQRAGGAENLVGTTAGRVCQLKNGVADDLGEPIVASVRTGFLDRDTSRRKHSKAVRLVLKRGEAASPGPVGLLRWRDDFGDWSASQEIYMGHVGESRPVVELRSLGVYRTRQWEFEFGGAVDYALASVEEDFDVLDA